MQASASSSFREPEILRQVFGTLYIGQNLRTMSAGHRYFQLPEDCSYTPFCDDFGPMNLASVYRFITCLNAELDRPSSSIQNIIFRVERGRRALANGVFLLGAYMLIDQGKSVAEVVSTFSWIDPTLVEGFRDATFVRVNFVLSIADCWRSVTQGIRLGWIRPRRSSYQSAPNAAAIDIKKYEHFDSPLHGDLHEVVPGKFVAFAAPVEPSQENTSEDANVFRGFAPEFYAEAMVRLCVTDIVQLNNSAYDTTAFTSKGITVHKLPFQDCTCPTEDIVESFLRIADGARGLVAVHCRAGLGRTGTLIARYMMRSHGFGARQAIGWLRIMRPGSVIGPQQQYLCAVEAAANAAPSHNVKKATKALPESQPEPPVAIPPDNAPTRSRWMRLQCLSPLADEEDPAAGPASPVPSWRTRLLPRAPWRSGSARSAARCDSSLADCAAAAADQSDCPGSLATQVRMGMAARGAARFQAQRKPAPGSSPGGGAPRPDGPRDQLAAIRSADLKGVTRAG